jgi:hypothetical protein
MELACSPVNFGVWLVPTGYRSAVTAVTLAVDGDTKHTGGDPETNIALSGKWPGPAVGECEVSGSTAADDVIGTVALSVNTGSFASNGGAGFSDDTALNVPDEEVSGFTYIMVTTLASPMLNGASEFKIYGTMSIPDYLIADNYGGYKAPDITVTYTN